MKICVVSFTKNGLLLSKRLKKCLNEEQVILFSKCSYAQPDQEEDSIEFIEESISDWAGEQMRNHYGLLFIGACGIAVRAIAPHVADKLSDSPVLVMDENGRHIIPVLSGHLGGANELAEYIAEKIGSKPVITTASDQNRIFAVDIFAKKNHLHIMNRDGIVKVSSKVLAGNRITLSVDRGHLMPETGIPQEIMLVTYPPTDPVDVIISRNPVGIDAGIWLCPEEYVIGIGCKKGKEKDELKEFVLKALRELDIKQEQIFAFASIDQKKEEPGLTKLCMEMGIPFFTFSSRQLQKVNGDFHTSEFVKSQVGVDNVCERAALMSCENNGTIIYDKHAENGMTLAIAKREWSVSFDEE